MTSADPLVVAGARRVDGLQRWLQARQAAPVERVETHLSWLLLAEHEVYKVKKPLALPFVDFTTLDVRCRCCADEVRLNRRLAPTLYLGVVELRGSDDAPTLDGAGPAIECAVKMRRFDRDALLAHRLAAGTLTADEIDRLAERIAAFHAGAAVARDEGADAGAAALRAVDGIEVLHGAGALADLRPWVAGEGERLAPLWHARRAAGRVREGHGDLHLANTLVLDGDVTAFDAIEFDPALRWIDVLADVAFLVMDLAAHGRDDLAARALNRYLDASGDHDGVATLRFFIVYRALVRAQVGLLRAAQGGAPDGPTPAAYLALARRHAAAFEPRLLITHGLPGAGKSWLAERLLEETGAIRLRADVERKRLFGLAALDESRARPALDLYGAGANRRTYDRLLALADAALAAGWPTIVDAAFLRRDERERFAALARRHGVPFAIADCRAPLPLLRERVAARMRRGGDPSEADVEVLERLATRVEPLTAAELPHAWTLEAGRAPEPAALAAAWRTALC